MKAPDSKATSAGYHEIVVEGAVPIGRRRRKTEVLLLVLLFHALSPAASGAPPLTPTDDLWPGNFAALKCRLVDFIDARVAWTHDFRDDGKSRVLELVAGKYRVTAAPKGFELAWFSYDFETAGRAGQPHLLVAELPNDAERYTTFTLTTPKDAPWAPPFSGQDKVKADAMQISQEPFWYQPDVGLSIYTGRDLELNDRPFLVRFLFYPKAARMKLTVSSSGWAQPVTANTGGAVSRIWIYAFGEGLAEHRPRAAAPEPAHKRRVGVYATHPWYFLAHYGVPPHTTAQRAQSLENLCDTLAFSGLNLIEFNAINGSDRASRAWYPGSYYPQLGADLLSELPPIAASRGIDLIPVVTSLTVPGRVSGTEVNRFGFSEGSFQQPARPDSDPRVFGDRPPDPLRPEVQHWLVRQLAEVAQRVKGAPNILGIGFRVNGKIGTCYVAGEDKSGPALKLVGAEEMGYSEWDLEQFRKATGFSVPLKSEAAYQWLRADPQRWDAWLDFRCRRTREVWLEARDAIQRFNPAWNLYVLADLPSEVPGTNLGWGGFGSPAKQSLDLLRAHGLDPSLFREDKGIVIQRVMMVDLDRFFSKWGPPFGTHPSFYRDFHEQEFLAELYRTPAGAATEIYHTYWEEPFHPDGEFGPDAQGLGLRTATATAWGRAFYRPASFSLRVSDDDLLVFTGWQRPTLGHEWDLRRFALAFRALPTGPFQALAVTPANERVVARGYGDRIAVINDTAEAREISVALSRKSGVARCLLDVSSGEQIPVETEALSEQRCTIQMKPYDIRAFAIER